MDSTTLPEWIAGLQQRAPAFSESYLAQRQRILADGAIPAKYKILMTMLVDALMAHPEGVAVIADRARDGRCLGSRDHGDGGSGLSVRRNAGPGYRDQRFSDAGLTPTGDGFRPRRRRQRRGRRARPRVPRA